MEDELVRSIVASNPARKNTFASERLQMQDQVRRQQELEAMVNEDSGAYGSAGATPRVDMKEEATGAFYDTAPGKYIDEQIGSEVKHFLGDYSDLPEGTQIGAMPSPGKIFSATGRVLGKMTPQVVKNAAKATADDFVKSGAQAIKDVGAKPLVDAITAGAKKSAPHPKEPGNQPIRGTKETLKKTPARVRSAAKTTRKVADRSKEVVTGTPKGTAATTRVAKQTGKRTRKIAEQGTRNRKGFNKAVQAQEKAKGSPLTSVEKRNIIKNQRNTQGLGKVVTKPRKRMKPQFKPSKAKPAPPPPPPKPKPKPATKAPPPPKPKRRPKP